MAGPIAGIATTAGVGAVGGIGAAGAEAGGVRAERPLVAGRALFPPAGVPVSAGRTGVPVPSPPPPRSGEVPLLVPVPGRAPACPGPRVCPPGLWGCAPFALDPPLPPSLCQAGAVLPCASLWQRVGNAAVNSRRC